MSRIQNQAINKGAEIVAEDISQAFNKFVGTKYSTGATRNEVTLQKARKINNTRAASIGWSGPKERYRLIHLNEFGYTRKGKKYRPRMVGTIEQTMTSSQGKYLDTVYKELKKEYAR
ncbi:hypothetical protein ACWOAH_10490 [Vagococcus vulneris]|uniref:hypothetical protein n=1 Tax=Vagococcus vulneris TaxID=1977869 RepID=UPI001403C140